MKVFLILSILGTFLGTVSAQETLANISLSGSASTDPVVAINQQGEACAVWVEKFSATSSQVCFSLYRNNSWSNPLSIPGQGGSSHHPHVTRGRGGNGFCCVWRDSSAWRIAYSEFNGWEWSTPVHISEKGSGDFGFPRVATTSKRIVVVWVQEVYGYTGTEIVGRIWNGGWEDIQNISRTWLTSKHPDIYAGTDERTYVVWQDASDTHQHPDGSWHDIFEVKMNVDDGGSAWGSALDVTNQDEWIFRAYAAVNSSNNIMVAYYYQSRSAYYASFRTNGSWTEPRIASDIGDHHDHDAYWADACSFGNGYLFIYRDVGYQIVYSSASNGALSQPIILGTGWNSHPSIDYHASFGAAAVWTCEESGEIFGMIFDPSDPPPNPPPIPGPNPTDKPVYPPLNVQLENYRMKYNAPIKSIDTFENRNVFSIQIVKKIFWNLPEAAQNFSVPMSLYRIFRKTSASTNWLMLKEVNGQTLQYEDKSEIQANLQYEYAVSGLDQYQSERYSYNLVLWEANPKNESEGVNVRFYRIYRKHPDDSGYGLWRVIDTQPIPQEDHTTEIRLGYDFDYAVTAVSESGRESSMEHAIEITIDLDQHRPKPETNSPKTGKHRSPL